ncbi:MAG TPA: aminoglycoside phosphotransferase family protein [Devosia sp.]|nr:aminoglycoside phosphotransferase family protein [Devosia sp.]
MSDIPDEYRGAIAASHPELSDRPAILHTRGWDSDAVEVGGTIFKFPKRPEAVERLRREVRFLALIRPRVRLTVPDMVLRETPRVFSEHRMIPGTIIETAGYDALSEAQKQAMGETLGQFYAELHAIPVADAIAIGAEPKPEWPGADKVLPILRERLPAAMRDYARKAFAAYAELPTEDQVFGYFDGHGWNMAFDHQSGVLNGVYDFADAAIGPRSREFTYSNLTSGDLTERIVSVYARLTGHAIDLRAVAIRTAVQGLSELAEESSDIEMFVAGATRWRDYVQSKSDLRL